MIFKVYTINTGGLQSPGKFASFLRDAKKWLRAGTHAIAVQEHNMSPAKHDEYTRMAVASNMDLHISYDTPGRDGTHWGGTLMLVDLSSATSSLVHSEAGCTIVSVSFLDETFKIGSIYAPVDPQKRIDFFNDIRRRKIFTHDLILGGDWNCVPDVTLDVQSADPLAYRNIGGTLLEDLMEEIDLADIRRVHLEEDKEPTRRGTRPTGGAIATRLDRWYVPTGEDFEHMIWSAGVDDALVWSKQSKDHSAVFLTCEFAEGDFGHERATIREDLMFEDNIQERVADIVEQIEQKHKYKVAH